MVVAALTVWVLFSCWLIASCVKAPRRLRATVMGLLAAELAFLLLWSYGTEFCAAAGCAPLAQAAGIAARVDLPILSALFLAGMAAQGLRGARG